MKKLKRKDLILEHYRKAIEATVRDNVTGKDITVRVWKPKSMGKLPAYRMRSLMEYKAGDLGFYVNPDEYCGPKENGAVWTTGNSDVGVWDMQTACRMDYRKSLVDIYVCALLIRPFSREAQQHYDERMGLPVWDRMLLMWDSRQFDGEGGYDTDYGKIRNWNGRWRGYDDLYRAVDEHGDIEEV